MFCGLEDQVLFQCSVFVERWSFSLQDPTFLVFFEFSEVGLS